MIYLHGFPLSNYYNKVKFQLLEKGLPFEEVPTATGSDDPAVLAASPLGKVPFLRCGEGTLCESAVIADWLEARHPEPRLLPADPWAAAKLREITVFLELHLELVARELYPQAFFGATLPERFVARVGEKLERNVAAFRRLARFGPYLGGDTFTLADCAGYVHLPLVALASKATLGRDLLTAHDIDWKGYVGRIEQRPAAQQVAAGRKADQARVAQLRPAPRG
ncbi:MAG TPA: glutathione S-transferase [Polyangiaceae bacterium]|nr:glutathione S-transferase [Polyangiaceae bacterium]